MTPYEQFIEATGTTPNERDFNYALGLETEILGDYALQILIAAANSDIPVTPWNILYMRPSYMWAVAL